MKYCRNCKYFSSLSIANDCKFPQKIFDELTGLYIIEYPIDFTKSNKNNDCKYYKKNWWKFWIKEDK